MRPAPCPFYCAQDTDRLFNLIGCAVRAGLVLSFRHFKACAEKGLCAEGSGKGRVKALAQAPVVAPLVHVRDWTTLIIEKMDSRLRRFGLAEKTGQAIHRFFFCLTANGHRLFYKYVSSDVGVRPLPASLGARLTVPEASGGGVFSGTVTTMQATGKWREWQVTVDEGTAVRTVIMLSPGIVIFPGELPQIEDLKQCPLNEKWYGQGGAWAKYNALHNKMVARSTEVGIWFARDSAARAEVEEFLRRWKPGACTACLLLTARAALLLSARAPLHLLCAHLS